VVVALGLFAVGSKLKVAVAGVVCSLTFHSRLYLVQKFMFMYVMWGVPNIQDRADWGGQAWHGYPRYYMYVYLILGQQIGGGNSSQVWHHGRI